MTKIFWGEDLSLKIIVKLFKTLLCKSKIITTSHNISKILKNKVVWSSFWENLGKFMQMKRIMWAEDLSLKIIFKSLKECKINFINIFDKICKIFSENKVV